ncbi:hypothetical protein ACFQ46_02090 [Kineococcus sp. GCM10028916]|uniref:hypothetical protein n=1 Tax=Kineococcus sp. GCM10028916 TaxID=3273394 RepID=UPI00363F420D
MPQQATITEPPIGGTRAQALLGVNPAQLNRLREVGLLGDEEALRAMQTEGGHWRYDEARVRELATRAWVDLPSPSADLAVHLAPLTPDPLHRGGRRYQGWHAFAHSRGLSAAEREDAWAGWWICRPERYLGAALVGDVCGFVVEVAAIRGFHLADDGRVRFELSRATKQVRARYAGRRFRAAQGAAVQPLGPTPTATAAGTTTRTASRLTTTTSRSTGVLR